MDKPQSVAYEELKYEIAELVNGSGLPAFIIEPIFVNFLMEIREAVKSQYEYEKSQYESYQMSQAVAPEADAEIIDNDVDEKLEE